MLSRCKAFVLQALKTDDLVKLLRHAVTDKRGFGSEKVEISDEILEIIANFANAMQRRICQYNIKLFQIVAIDSTRTVQR